MHTPLHNAHMHMYVTVMHCQPRMLLSMTSSLFYMQIWHHYWHQPETMADWGMYGLLFLLSCMFSSCLYEFHCNQAAWRIPVIVLSEYFPVHEQSTNHISLIKQLCYAKSCTLPSILQVNASPSLSHTTPSDRVMKTSLINDIINIVLSPSGFPEYASMKSCIRDMQWCSLASTGRRCKELLCQVQM